MKAVLKNYRQSPRKVRLLADLIRGKSVPRALEILTFTNKKASEVFTKLINSAVANAKKDGHTAEKLTVKTAVVDKGTVYKRYKARARGRAAQILKRNSHITVELATK